MRSIDSLERHCHENLLIKLTCTCFGTFAHSGDGGNDDPSGTDNPISSNKDALPATQRFKCTSESTIAERFHYLFIHGKLDSGVLY